MSGPPGPASPPGRDGLVVGDVLWVYWVAFPVLGAGLGWLFQAVADWLPKLRWLPFRPVFRLLAEQPYQRRIIGALVVGGLIGLGFTLAALRERLTVTVGARQVTLLRDDRPETTVERDMIGTVFPEGKELVLLDQKGAELVREASDLRPGRLREAFLAYGYPWRDSDPHESAYRRWAVAAPELPDGADALLRLRARALITGHGDEADDLRAALARIGLVVRDREKRQYWRRTDGA